MRLKSTNVVFIMVKNLALLEDVDSDNMHVSSMISSGEKNCKSFIGYKDDDYKVKLLRIMLRKTSAYCKKSDGETKWINFLIEHDDFLKKYIMIFGIKSVAVLKKLTAIKVLR